MAMIEALLQPLSLAWLALLGIGAAAAWRRHRALAAAALVPAVLLHLLGATPLSPWLLSRLEEPYRHSARSVPAVPAVVLLGGTHDFSPRNVLPLDFGGTVDRVLTAVELVRQEPSRVLVLGGSRYDAPDGGARPDAELIRDWLERWGIAPREVVILGICTSTRDEAERTRALAAARGWDRVAMVSSAGHLRRAGATFRRAGVPVVPVGCDFTGISLLEGSRHWFLLPRIGHLAVFSQWLHEELGWAYYRVRGWT